MQYPVWRSPVYRYVRRLRNGIGDPRYGHLPCQHHIHDTATYHVNIMAIKQNGKFSMTVITPDTCLPENSTILVLGTQRDIQKCFHI